jgi:hypothetical protein
VHSGVSRTAGFAAVVQGRRGTFLGEADVTGTTGLTAIVHDRGTCLVPSQMSRAAGFATVVQERRGTFLPGVGMAGAARLIAVKYHP